MDLSTLPEEMMARVLIRTKYQTVIQLRKMNSRIDIIAKKYHVGTKLPVKELSYEYYLNDEEDEKPILCYMGFQIDGEIARFHVPNLRQSRVSLHQPHKPRFSYRLMDTDSFQKCEILLKKVQVMDELNLQSPINDKFIDVLLNQKTSLRDARTMYIWPEGSEPTFSTEKIRKLIASCRRLETFSFANDGYTMTNMAIFCNEEVFGGRKWYDLTFYGGLSTCPNRQGKSFLSNVVRNCTKFDYEGNMPTFNVYELMDFIEVCLEEKDFFAAQEWQFGDVLYGYSSLTDVMERLNRSKAIQCTTDDYSNKKYFEIILPAYPNVRIDFHHNNDRQQ